MKQRIAAVLAAAALVVIPVSGVSAAPAKQSCVRLSLPNETVCSPNGFEYRSVGEKFVKVYKVVRNFTRPEDRRPPLFQRSLSFSLVFVGYLLSEQTAAK